MGNMNKLFDKISGDTELTRKYNEIITPETNEESASKLSKFAEHCGVFISVNEIKEYFSNRELSDDELESIAGGIYNADSMFGPFCIV